MKDFNYRPLHVKIEPLLVLFSSKGNFLSVRVKPGEWRQTIQLMEQEWKKYAQQAPFEYSFLDENFDAQYRAERQTANLFIFFTGLAIFIAYLGLFGLATFIAEQRTKEIGIRKVLGASVWRIVSLLSRDFLKLVLLANVIAWPLAWFLIDSWLQGFAYRTPIRPWAFIGAATIALAIALLTVTFQAVKVARANPIQSLRIE